VENLLLGSAAFPGGHVEGGRYLVDVHGGVVELTATQYWFSYIHGVSVFASIAIAAVLALLSLDDLKDESANA
jgi:hypothetical protein